MRMFPSSYQRIRFQRQPSRSWRLVATTRNQDQQTGRYSRARQRAIDRQPHHVRLVDDAKFLDAAGGLKGVVFRHPLTVLVHCLGVVDIPQRITNILANKPRLAARIEDSEKLRTPFTPHCLRGSTG